MAQVITEITPLSEKDCFYLIDREKSGFDYPLHRHCELELNFVTGCKGAVRVVGDSIEHLGHYDLVLIGPELEHCWEQGECDNSPKREITIQFSSSLLSPELLAKNQMKPIARMMEMAKRGVAFGMDTILSNYARINALTIEQPSFLRLIHFLELCYYLSISNDIRELSTSSFANHKMPSDSRRVNRVEDEISRNYASDLPLEHLARIAGMTPTSFSRFFRKRTGRTISEYISDIRIGHAARKLVDTTMSVSEICYSCGFNNLSNFNRAFKRKKGCTPKEFRDNYLKTKIII